MSNLRSNQEIVVTQELLNQSTDTVLTLNALEPLNTWSSGNNATFLGGGTLQGTFTKETSSPISGAESYRYVQAAGSLNDYIASPIYSVSQILRGKSVFLEFPYKYDGANDDIELILWDVTNSARIELGDSKLLDAASNVNILKINCDIPQTCTQIRVGIQVKVLNSTRILIFDDVRVQLQATTEVQTPVLIQEPDSVISLNTSNGYGSTGTRIRRFSNLAESRGTDILYQDSATNGASFTIQTDGIYGISFTDSETADQEYIGLSVNAASLSTGIETTPVAQRLIMNRISGSLGHVAWEGYLKAGDVVRAHTNGAAAATASHANFIIAKAKQLKIVNASQDNKIEIPRSEVRFEGASTRGATATAIVRFDTLTKNIGDAFTIESDATLGTRITMKKRGKLNVNTSLVVNGATAITLNQATLTAFPTNSAESIATDSTNAVGLAACPSASIFVNIGDVIRVSANNTPQANSVNSLNLYFQEQDISVSVSNTLPQFSQSDSYVRLRGQNGYGSTGTRIPRFTTIDANIGTDILYQDSATDGSSFTVQSDGIYHVNFSADSVTNNIIGISKNASSLSTNLGSLAGDQILAYGAASTGLGEVSSWSGYLVKGDIIRPHTHGAAIATSYNFSVAKVGKPNVTGVDVTPFVNLPQPERQEIRFRNAANGFGSTWTNNRRFTTPYLNSGNTIIRYIDDASTGAIFEAVKRCKVDINYNGSFSSTNTPVIRITLNQAASSPTIGETLSLTQNPINLYTDASTSVILNPGDRIRLNLTLIGTFNTAEEIFSISAEAESEAVATVNDIFNSDSNTLTYAGSATYTLSTLTNAPIGTFITWTYAANTNTATQTNAAAPTQTTSDMNTNGIRIYPRAFNASSTAVQPARVAIQIGKGLKGVSLRGYSATGKVGQIALDNVVIGNTERGITQSYNENTGVLILDAGLANTGTGTARDFIDTEAVNTTAVCYVVINAAKTPDLSVIAPNNKRVAILKDVKTSGTNGGSFTSGAYQTRVLNDEYDPLGIVTLSGNQFTLGPGTYLIEASAPAKDVNGNKVKIRNITDSTDAIIGSSSITAGEARDSWVRGAITLSASKTFELQHRCNTTRATDGFGTALSYGDVEVYAQVIIEKIN